LEIVEDTIVLKERKSRPVNAPSNLDGNWKIEINEKLGLIIYVAENTVQLLDLTTTAQLHLTTFENGRGLDVKSASPSGPILLQTEFTNDYYLLKVKEGAVAHYRANFLQQERLRLERLEQERRRAAQLEEERRQAAQREEERRRAELEEQQRRLREAREARLRKEAEDRRRMEQEERDRVTLAWTNYEAVWDIFQQAASTSSLPLNSLGFQEIPWPVSYIAKNPSALTKEAISYFLLSEHHSADKPRRKRLREAMLRFHPDPFQLRIMPAVREVERVDVKEAADAVSRILTSLLSADI
jgi:hypothetical protein